MKRDVIDRPIFFIGMPRSGTTIVQEAFSIHENLGWLSNYSAHFPGAPWLTAVHRLFGGKRGQRSQGQSLSVFNKMFPRPDEPYCVWERLFGDKFLYTFLIDVQPTQEEVNRAVKYVSVLLRAQNKPRFCGKLTGPPRIEFLRKVFPQSHFIDVIRDPRAVVASLMVDRDNFWERQGGMEKPFWEGALNEPDLELWRQSGQMPCVLAGLQWASVYERTKVERSLDGVNYTRVFYENYVEQPKAVLNELAEFSGLARSDRMDAYVDSLRYGSKNRKYFDVLSRHELTWLERAIGKQLDELGYQRAAS